MGLRLDGIIGRQHLGEQPMHDLTIDGVLWNIGVGIVASAVWEGIKGAFRSLISLLGAREKSEPKRSRPRGMPFLRNAIIFSVLLIGFAFFDARNSMLHVF
jgi:hypothetical protein